MHTAEDFSVGETDGEFRLRASALVHAPIDRCFRLTCTLELVQEELGMKHVSGGDGSGLVTGGDVVRWEGWQLGWKHFHVSHISSFVRPVFLQDTMIDGRFKTFRHDHHLRETEEGTVLEDELLFSLPFGLPGRLVARWIMVPHIRKLLSSRFERIRSIAESERWRSYLPEEECSTPA